MNRKDDFNFSFLKGSDKILQNSNENNENSNIKEDGSFEKGDVPKAILECRRTNVNGVYEFAIQWNARKGRIPRVSVYTNVELRKYAPKLLIEFYEKNLKFEELGKK